MKTQWLRPLIGGFVGAGLGIVGGGGLALGAMLVFWEMFPPGAMPMGDLVTPVVVFVGILLGAAVGVFAGVRIALRLRKPKTGTATAASLHLPSQVVSQQRGLAIAIVLLSLFNALAAGVASFLVVYRTYWSEHLLWSLVYVFFLSGSFLAIAIMAWLTRRNSSQTWSLLFIESIMMIIVACGPMPTEIRLKLSGQPIPQGFNRDESPWILTCILFTGLTMFALALVTALRPRKPEPTAPPAATP